MRKWIIWIIWIVPLVLTSCAGNLEQHRPEKGSGDTNFTLGLVQREISPGMSQAEVASAIGSPNIVTKDGSGQEVWIYDKIASVASFESKHTNAGLLGGVGGLAGSVLLLGIPSVNYDSSASLQTKSERTLTVVIKFDSKRLVREANYHSSQF